MLSPPRKPFLIPHSLSLDSELFACPDPFTLFTPHCYYVSIVDYTGYHYLFRGGLAPIYSHVYP